MRPHTPSYRRIAVPVLSLACLLTVAACAKGPAHPVMTMPTTKRANTWSGPPSPGTAEAGWPRRPTTQVVFSGSRHSGLVALTFDSNLTTAMIQRLRRGQVRSYDNHAVIDELIALHVPATFFLSGLWMLQYPAETHRIANNLLFEVGTHSFSHRGFRPRCYDLGTLPVTQMSADVLHAERVLARFTDHPSPYFRFPGGCYDRTALAAIAPSGVTVIQYDVASGDAFGTNVAQIVAHTLADTRSGSIVVLHITGGDTAPLTALALPQIVHGLRARGLRPVSISQLLRAT